MSTTDRRNAHRHRRWTTAVPVATSRGAVDDRRRGEGGQVIVLFALALVAMLGMVGLVLDGGSAFGQRRSEQSAADLAALAGANDFLLNGNVALAQQRALDVAAQNGYTHGTGGTSVTVSVTTDPGARVKVSITSPHRNAFAAVMGMSSWDVSASGTALTGFPDTAVGAAPFMLSIDTFGTNGVPYSQYADSAHPYSFGEVNGDAPASAGDLAWTNYGTGNVDSNEVRRIINGQTVVSRTLEFGDYIGQENNGNHTTLYGDVNTVMAGHDYPIPIVDANGHFQGWATFHVVSASGGSDKTITGYFKSSFRSPDLTIGGCEPGDCPRYLGSYVLRLVD